MSLKQQAVTVRLDTGAVWNTRPATEDELQLKLGIDDK